MPSDSEVENVVLQEIQFLPFIQDCESIQGTHNRWVQQGDISEMIKTVVNSSR